MFIVIYKKNEMTFADMAIAKNHKENYLDKLDMIINWERIKKVVVKMLSKKKSDFSAAGNPAYSPLIMFKVLLYARFENLSDLQTETALRDRLSAMRFTGLGVMDDKPDETTICRFRNLLIREKLYEKLFCEIEKQLEENGLKVKKRDHAIVDASIISSSRRPRKVVENIEEDRNEKDDDDQNNGSGSGTKTTYSDDSDAAWIKKGKKVEYGFKIHVAVDCEGFLIGGHVTPANKSDTKELAQVLEESNLEKDSLVLADKGYRSAENSKMIQQKGYLDLTMEKASKNNPLSESQIKFNKKISKYRYRVEQSFGILKKYYGLSRARYLGIAKVTYELFMNGLCMNLKKAMNKVSLCATG